MPLAAEIRSVHNAFPVGRGIRTGLPRGLFVMNLACLRAGLRLHSPEAAGSVDVSAVRNENHLGSVRRPGWADLMIEFAVVEARQIAAGFAGKPPHVGQLATAEIAGKNMKAPVIRSGNEG